MMIMMMQTTTIRLMMVTTMTMTMIMMTMTMLTTMMLMTMTMLTMMSMVTTTMVLTMVVMMMVMRHGGDDYFHHVTVVLMQQHGPALSFSCRRADAAMAMAPVLNTRSAQSEFQDRVLALRRRNRKIWSSLCCCRCLSPVAYGCGCQWTCRDCTRCCFHCL